ncbi:wall-associated receptor kinase-like 1 isoform X1 [Setaria viridis]|uniref:wall-associated receptor kinase-like 1 isoform X1 n=1 Tax=Setaria viridis TaxID=4556 RepID=UPI003B3A45E4
MDYQGNNLRDFLENNGHVVLQRVNNYNLRSFTEKEIDHITNGYSNLLGKGAFGKVYKGALDGQCLVAVKKYKDGMRKEEFAKEVIVHCQINHKNVVRLLGCCTEENTLMIVMEFVCNGNLSNILHCSNANGHVPFPLDKRLDIAIELAEVLSCMHSMYSPVLHGDIKPANILLDENLVPKLSDFGIARLLSTNETQQTRNIVGSIGYLDPLFIQTGLLTPKSDVYSFGVVLVEMITRKKVADGNVNLIQNFTKSLKRGKAVRKMFDEEIVYGKKKIIVLEDIAKLAVDCLRLEDILRPEMVEVADKLRKCRKDLELRRMGEKTGPSILLMSPVKKLGQNPVVKNLDGFFSEPDEEFILQVQAVSSLKHDNVVQLLGYCVDGNVRAIIYDYSSRGSLHDILHGKNGAIGTRPGQVLSWAQRVKIALSAAQGIEFLHHKTESCIIHSDIKSSNILLFDNDVAKIGDLRVSKNQPGYLDDILLDCVLPSNNGYQYHAPECRETGEFSREDDMYSFGVVLLELITGRISGYSQNRLMIGVCDRVTRGIISLEDDAAAELLIALTCRPCQYLVEMRCKCNNMWIQGFEENTLPRLPPSRWLRLHPAVCSARRTPAPA